MTATDDLQFYPTPPELAKRAWDTFKDVNFMRVLEPSAGAGSLAEAAPHKDYWGRYRQDVDCIEIDITKHSALREKGFNVVGIDFMSFSSGACYSHVIMNPPFSDGDKHVLKAWDILWDGEIVAIINAETIRNPFSKERQRLVGLIQNFGSVEFIEGAFMVEEAERKTSVDVALIWLRKQADIQNDIVGTVLKDLKEDAMTPSGLAGDYHDGQELALPITAIENSVLAFKAAVKTTREAILARAKCNYYAALLGDTMAVLNGDMKDSKAKADTSVDFVKKELAKEYDELKDRAWASILRSADVVSKLSSKAQKAVEKEFAQISKLEFTVSNIYGFLCGLVENRGKLQLDMACEVFDLITRYHSDNTVFYKGWKSNDKHRTCAMRIKTTRFILPGHRSDSWASSLGWDSMQTLGDLDKVFAMLDGKISPEYGLQELFGKEYKQLRRGGRFSSTYFDVRYYRGAGTIHFFAKDKKLVDRLNKIVGKARQWIPPSDEMVSKDFWLQYEKAEKFDKAVRAEIDKQARTKSYWQHPLHNLSFGSETAKETAIDAIDQALAVVLEQNGINMNFQIGSAPQEAQLTLLLQAA